MITYRTCLFDMRLDDLWDPDQRWALLSDTASKHARTDPVVFLYQYYFRPARLLAIHVDESARAQQQEVLEYRFRGRDKQISSCWAVSSRSQVNWAKLTSWNSSASTQSNRDAQRVR